MHVKALRCDGGDKIGHSRGWTPEEEGQTITIAVGVPAGTCFQLSFSGDGPFDYQVSGSVEY
jgi:hypothetical protein